MSTPQPDTSPDTTPDTSPNTSDVLIDFIIAFFVPMFLADSNGNIALARLAAVETMNAYRIRHHYDLLAVAQIVAFGIATLSSLSLSMADDISLSMVLRLRGNANACNRSAERSRKVLHAIQQAEESAAPPDLPTSQARPPAHAPQQPAPQQPASLAGTPLTDQERRAWAAACAEVAEEYTAELPNLPPEEQKLASIRIDALNSSVSTFLAGVGGPVSTPYPQGSAIKPQGV